MSGLRVVDLNERAKVMEVTKPMPTKNALRMRKYRSDNREKSRALDRARDRSNRAYWPHKQHARDLVRAAISEGELTKLPCEECGCIDVQAHHDDYEKPLEVRWLCRLHHEEQHAVMSAAACRTHCSVKELEPLASFRLRPATRARSPLTATVRQRQHDWPGTTPRR